MVLNERLLFNKVEEDQCSCSKGSDAYRHFKLRQSILEINIMYIQDGQKVYLLIMYITSRYMIHSLAAQHIACHGKNMECLSQCLLLAVFALVLYLLSLQNRVE